MSPSASMATILSDAKKQQVVALGQLGSPVSGAWTVARWPSLPLFGGRTGPADGPASLGFGQRPDHDAPILVITMGRRAHGDYQPLFRWTK